MRNNNTFVSSNWWRLKCIKWSYTHSLIRTRITHTNTQRRIAHANSYGSVRNEETHANETFARKKSLKSVFRLHRCWTKATIISRFRFSLPSCASISVCRLWLIYVWVVTAHRCWCWCLMCTRIAMHRHREMDNFFLFVCTLHAFEIVPLCRCWSGEREKYAAFNKRV